MTNTKAFSAHVLRFFSLGLLLWGITATQSIADGKVSLSTLLDEMVARERLARFPSPKYTCKQFSSYDRRSTTPDDPKTWFANWDRSQFVRIDEVDGKKQFVLMDTEGPGAIVRIWGTWHGPKGEPFSNGTLKIYLDGSETPAIEGPVADVIDGDILTEGCLSQGVSPETDYRRQGHNLYVPIPYAKSCKITYETDVFLDEGGKTGEALYYQINYRTYEPGTEVETFSMERLEAAREKLDNVQKQLVAQPRDEINMAALDENRIKIEPGDELKVATSDKQGSIRRLMLQFGKGTSPQALRSVVLKIAFDGEECVWVPVGDFFGVGYKPSPYRTWYTAYSKDGVMSCEWVMPFESSCKVSLENLHTEPVEVALAWVGFGEWKWDDRSMHFHSTWRQLTGEKTLGSKNMDIPASAKDVNYVTVEGQGVYVGDTLTLFNGAPRWWGEGDEKIYVDGEDFPSHFGTGTEDYYGYAWCRPEKFSAPFHAQPDGSGNLEGGYAVNSRYRALDAIPFEKSLKFDMELWHWAPATVNYAPTTFFYARPGAKVNVPADAESAKIKVALSNDDLPQD